MRMNEEHTEPWSGHLGCILILEYLSALIDDPFDPIQRVTNYNVMLPFGGLQPRRIPIRVVWASAAICACIFHDERNHSIGHHMIPFKHSGTLITNHPLPHHCGAWWSGHLCKHLQCIGARPEIETWGWVKWGTSSQFDPTIGKFLREEGCPIDHLFGCRLHYVYVGWCHERSWPNSC